MFLFCLLLLLSSETLLKESQVIPLAIRDETKLQPIERNVEEVNNNDVIIDNSLQEDRESFEPKAQKNTQNLLLDYSVCKNKFCLGLGQRGGTDCVEDKSCDLLLSGGYVDRNEGQTEFELSAVTKAGAHTSKYYSMAFSEDNQMGNDLVTDCLVTSDGKVKVGSSYNSYQGKDNHLTDEYKDSVQTILANYRDGIVRCRWRSHRNRTVDDQKWDLMGRRYHILLAMGDLSSDVGTKEYHSARLATNEAISLAEIGAISVSDPIYLVRIHGSLMVIAWVGCVSLSIVLARYFKDTWVESTLCGVKIWFAFHRGLMVTGVVLMLIAQTCIFYYLKEYRFGWHQILGTTAFTLAILNPLGALLRPHPEAPERWMFNWGHWALGNIGHITAIVAIFLSTNLHLADLPKAFIWAVVSFVLFYVVIHLLLQFHTFCLKTRKTHDIALQDMGQSPDGRPVGTDAPGSGFRRFILGIYSVVILAFVITMVSLICLSKTTLDMMSIS